jgi:hypothetical protein
MIENLRKAAFNRHRDRLFGKGAALHILASTPETGETVIASVSDGWTGQRTQSISDERTMRAESGLWQFQIAEQPGIGSLMNSAVAIVAAGRRWRIKKTEKPVGASAVWKIRAEIQNDTD